MFLDFLIYTVILTLGLILHIYYPLLAIHKVQQSEDHFSN